MPPQKNSLHIYILEFYKVIDKYCEKGFKKE